MFAAEGVVTRSHTVLITLCSLAGTTLLAACGREPKLGVQTSSNASSTEAADVPPESAQAAPPAPGMPVELPAGHPPIEASGAPAGGGAMTLVPVDPGAGRGETGLSWTAPAGWLAEPPANSMRRAQYKVSGPGGDGECVVFYFGPGQGGGPMENAQRWASQFTPADGRNPLEAMKTTLSEAGGVQVLQVETTGTYTRGR